MPFGAVFGSLVFGVVATFMGWRLAHDPSVMVALSGVFLLVLGVSLAIGLLLQRPWARWMGLIGAVSLGSISVTMVLQGRGESLGLAGILAATLTLVLLAVPKTGRFEQAAVPGRASIWTGRVFAGLAVIALAGLAGVIIARRAVAIVAGVPASVETPGSSSAPTTQQPSSPARPGTLEWHDFAPGMQKAKAAGKPVLVDFYAEWCGPCKMMERETFRDAKVIQRLGDVVAVRVDAEGETPLGGVTGYEVAEQYRVESYPTIALLDAEGRVMARFSGYRGPREFLQWLDGAIGKSARSVRS